MALVTVEGTYRDGKVELAEQPQGVEGARVIVTFLATPEETENGARGVSGARDEEREQAAKRVIERMQKGIDLGGPPFPTREQIYDERLKRFDR